MKRRDFERLKKAMALAASESDGEALNAIRAANKILKDAGDLTWERVLDRSLKIVPDYEPDPQASAPAPKGARWSQGQEDRDLVEQAVRRFPDNKFVRDVAEHLELATFITKRQREALKLKLGDGA